MAVLGACAAAVTVINRWLRSRIVFWPVAIAATFFCSLGFVLNNLRFPRVTAGIYCWWGKAFLWAASVRLRVFGEVPKKGPFVVVSNHASLLDIAAVFVVMRGHVVCFASNPKIFDMHFFGVKTYVLGWGMRAGEAFEVDPNGGLSSLRALTVTVKDRAARGYSVAIFPEGTRSRNGEVNGFRAGAFVAAVHTGVPILPLRFRELDRALPSGGRVPTPVQAHVVVGEPVAVHGRKPRGLSDTIHAWMTHAA